MSNTFAGELMTKALILAAMGAALAVAMTLPAQAANRSLCRDYAATAMRQVREARMEPACWDLLNNWDRWQGRWNPVYEQHYGWCLGAPWDAVGYEQYSRVLYLRQCRLHPDDEE